MTFLIENKTFLTLETKIKVNPPILVISGKIGRDFFRLKKKRTAFVDYINKAIKKSKK